MGLGRKVGAGIAGILLLSALASGRVSSSSPAGTGFTYQGQLKNAGQTITGLCDFRFGLWDAAAGGARYGTVQTLIDVNVVNGLFTVQLNSGGEFGASAFDGTARWLDVAVRCGSDLGYTSLGRMPLQATPMAQQAANAANADKLDGLNSTQFLRSDSNGSLNGELLINGWVRTQGAAGWYSQTYGGGWYMSDPFYLRAYNNKSIYTAGQVIADDAVFTRTLQLDSTQGISFPTDPYGGSGDHARIYVQQDIPGTERTSLVLENGNDGPGQFVDMIRLKAGTVGIQPNAGGGGDLVVEGHVYAHGGTHIGDVAEPTAAVGVEPGDVVVSAGFDAAGKLTVKQATAPYSKTVVGIISSNPSLTLAGKADDTPLAVTGIVPVKVVGPVAEGDLLTTSATPGHAMACRDAAKCFGTTIGKALESHPGDGEGLIRVLVTLR